MPAYDVREDWNRTTGGRLDPTTFKLLRTSQRHYTALLSDPSNDTPIRVKASGVFPLEGNRDPDDSNLICVSSEVKPMGPTLMECTATYETIPIEDPSVLHHPVFPGWAIEFDSEDSQEPFDRDWEDFPIQTATGERFDPPLTGTVTDFSLTFSTTNRPFPAGLLALYRNSLNSDWFMNQFPPGTCRMRRTRGKTSRQGNDLTMECSATVSIRFGLPGTSDHFAWWHRVRAEGYYVMARQSILDETLKRVRATDADGEPVVTPISHDAETGEEIPTAETEFYLFLPPWMSYKPFNDFFNSIAGV